jgi:hypothetical protein
VGEFKRKIVTLACCISHFLVDASHARHKLRGFSEDDAVGCGLLLIIICLQQLRLEVPGIIFLLRLDYSLTRACQSFFNVVSVVIIDTLRGGRRGMILIMAGVKGERDDDGTWSSPPPDSSCTLCSCAAASARSYLSRPSKRSCSKTSRTSTQHRKGSQTQKGAKHVSQSIQPPASSSSTRDLRRRRLLPLRRPPSPPVLLPASHAGA